MVLRTVRVLSITMLVACALPLLAVQSAQAIPPGCTAGFESDFNGDGFSDAVVGDPYVTVSGHPGAGAVTVLYGDSDGRIGEGYVETLTQGDFAIGDHAETGDRFGFALAAADLNCDGYTDLVVGTPYEDMSGQADSGIMQILWGADHGVGLGDLSSDYTQTDFGEVIRAGDQLGYAVDALEDVEQDGASAPFVYTVAIGVPGGDVGIDHDAGWVGTLSPTVSGAHVDVLTQDTTGIPDSSEPGDRFGASLSLNYLGGDSLLADLAIGAPNEDLGGVLDAGSVTIARDLYLGIDGAVTYNQDSSGVASVPEPGDRFGYSLDSMRTGSTTRLAVGVPYEDIGAAASAGLVQLFSGDGNILTAGVGLTQDTNGVADGSETGDLFGERVAWARPGLGDTVSRLAVSAPSEDGTAGNTGLVQVFPMTNLAAERSYSQSSPGIPGNPEEGDRFGSSLAVVSGLLERVLLVGAPDDVGNSSGMVAVIPFGAGETARSWRPGVGGVLPDSSRFGYSLASSG